jgi:hypothetical protein
MTTHASWADLRNRRMQEPGAAQAYDATRNAFSSDMPTRPQDAEASSEEPDDQAPQRGRRTD